MKDEKDRKTNEMARHFRQTLRATRLAARRAVAPERVAAWSRQIVAHLLRAFPEPPGKCIAFCWPIHNEPDIRAAIVVWREAGAAIALPVTLAPKTPLAFRAWTPQTPLAVDASGVPAPASGALAEPDVFIIPLNVFDAAGYRLGYGGGFFDRTLTALPRTPLTLGVGFELGRVESIWPQAHDYPVDWLFTEAGFWAATRARPLPRNGPSPTPENQPPELHERRP
ncbi:MAG: 5-formyltetrahydrofolate cyclo-ligase [Zoogloeaceae bacterium]|jgi:5,10-methenyltetrahydrofolate synthetase|nr:5-formyltetrahydrofolate cyclo-ligase [Zoogloeaceae bacterium]